jgi:hypothetical protein
MRTSCRSLLLRSLEGGQLVIDELLEGHSSCDVTGHGEYGWSQPATLGGEEVAAANPREGDN